MSRKLRLPDAPVADDGGALSAPSALRNREAITDVVARLAPPAGRALEIASGTGEHVLRFAAATPGLTWYPSDLDDVRLTSIAAWRAREGDRNIAEAMRLDACAPGWAARHGPFEMIVLVNLLHLISDAQAQILLKEIAQALAPGGIALIYGPFLRDGEATSEGDATFHASLRAQDPLIGYKDVVDIAATLTGHGLHLIETVKMPANNLMLCLERKSA